jgi:hypothetical protein
MKKFWKIILIIIGTIFFIFIALIGIGVFVDFEYDDHIENGRYTYVPEDEIFLLYFLSGTLIDFISALLFHGNQRIFSGLAFDRK